MMENRMTEASFVHQKFPGNMNHAGHVTVLPLPCDAAISLVGLKESMFL
jgi:hypothetical protein